jgi:uncharacterized cupin superfamily protein
MIRKQNINGKNWQTMSQGDSFQHDRIALTGKEDDAGIGCGAYRVAPGKRAFPNHAHLANDEALFVLSGGGLLMMGEEKTNLVEGDFVLLPRGSDFSHVLINDTQDDLLYLCISTMNMPDVVYYPDSDKLGVLEHKFWDGKTGAGTVGGMYQRKIAGYWDGEE